MLSATSTWWVRASCLLAVLAAVESCRGNTSPDVQASAELHGHVHSANGRPLGGIRVLLARGGADLQAPAVASTTTNAKGAFKLTNARAGRYLLRAESPSYSAAVVAIELAPGERLTTSLRLEPEQLLEGVVQDSRGRPLPEAVVLAWPSGRRGAAVVESRAGDDGRFTLAGLSRGAWTILAEASGFGTLQLERVDVPARKLVLRLEGEARSLSGIVLGPDGQGRAGARVILGGASLREPRQTVSGQRGLFVFHGVGLGRFTVRAAQGELSSLPTRQTVDETTGWLSPLRVALRPGVFAAGRVTDDDGRPLAGVTVEIVAMPSDDLPQPAQTDNEGRFSFGPLPPGTYRVLARLPGYALAESPELKLRLDLTPKVELRLSRAAGLTGRVIDDAGRPVARVSITALSLLAGPDDIAVLPRALPLAAEVAELPAHKLIRQGKVRTAVSDPNGRFVVDDMPAGRVRLELAHPDKLPKWVERIFVAPGEMKDLGALTIATGAWVTGKVLGERAEGIAAARVEARPVGRASAAALRVASEADGSFALRVPGGEYAFTATAPGHSLQALYAVRIEEGKTATLELRLARAEGTLDGDVREVGSGRPITRATIVALPGNLPSGAQAITLAQASSDAAGRFRLTGLPRGLLRLEVKHPKWPTAQVSAQVGTLAVIELARPGSIQGEIRDKINGAFVSRYQLDAIGPGGRRADQMKQIGAGFELAGLTPGRWTLKVSAVGYEPYERVLDVPPSASPKEPSVRSVKLELIRRITVAP